MGHAATRAPRRPHGSGVAVTALGPLDHLSRPPLPWRAPHLTECGKPLDTIDASRIISRDELHKRVADIGQKRAAFSTCMTCWETRNRWPGDSATALYRETHVVWRAPPSYYDYAPRRSEGEQRRSHDEAKARRDRFVGELEAIQALIEAHREEFDAYLAGLGETVSLADHRNTRRKAGG